MNVLKSTFYITNALLDSINYQDLDLNWQKNYLSSEPTLAENDISISIINKKNNVCKGNRLGAYFQVLLSICVFVASVFNMIETI